MPANQLPSTLHDATLDCNVSHVAENSLTLVGDDTVLVEACGEAWLTAGVKIGDAVIGINGVSVSFGHADASSMVARASVVHLVLQRGVAPPPPVDKFTCCGIVSIFLLCLLAFALLFFNVARTTAWPHGPRSSWMPDYSGGSAPSHRQPKNGAMRHYIQSNWHPGTTDGADCPQMRRLGKSGAGGKMICAAAMPPPYHACHVVSIGLGGGWSFESSMKERFPHCRITLIASSNSVGGPKRDVPSYVQFRESFDVDASWSAHFLAPRRATPRLDVLKIDCEGCEYTSLAPLLAHVCVEQVLLHIHGTSEGRLEPTRQLLGGVNRTHGVFYSEPNIEFSDGTSVEYSWRRRPDAPACVGPLLVARPDNQTTDEQPRKVARTRGGSAPARRSRRAPRSAS